MCLTVVLDSGQRFIRSIVCCPRVSRKEFLSNSCLLTKKPIKLIIDLKAGAQQTWQWLYVIKPIKMNMDIKSAPELVYKFACGCP